jgi:hypothetical protein
MEFNTTWPKNLAPSDSFGRVVEAAGALGESLGGLARQEIKGRAECRSESSALRKLLLALRSDGGRIRKLWTLPVALCAADSGDLIVAVVNSERRRSPHANVAD